MSDLREQLLTRLQQCIGAVAPGVTYNFPFGYDAPVRVLESDLGGGTDPAMARVYSKMRPIVRPDLTELPMVEIVTAINQPDSIATSFDDQMFERTMNVQIWGYVAGQDAADDLNSKTRPAMNALLADLQLAVEAFPYWTGTDAPLPLTATHGAVTITPKSQFTEPAVEQPVGILVLDYAISFKFHRLSP